MSVVSETKSGPESVEYSPRTSKRSAESLGVPGVVVVSSHRAVPGSGEAAAPRMRPAVSSSTSSGANAPDQGCHRSHRPGAPPVIAPVQSTGAPPALPEQHRLGERALDRRGRLELAVGVDDPGILERRQGARRRSDDGEHAARLERDERSRARTRRPGPASASSPGSRRTRTTRAWAPTRRSHRRRPPRRSRPRRGEARSAHRRATASVAAARRALRVTGSTISIDPSRAPSFPAPPTSSVSPVASTTAPASSRGPASAMDA